MSQRSIFVSHSHHDNEWRRTLVAALKAVGYDVWYDETGLTGGAAWVASIQREVQSRDVFLLVLTPESWASEWVQDELQLAIATRRRILPVLLRNTKVDGFLLTTQWVTAIGEEPQAATRSLILAIEAPPAPGRGPTPQASTEKLDDLVTLCQSLLAERRYTEALSACGRALALDPNNLDVLRVQGSALNQIGQRTRAAAVFARTLSQLNPTNANQKTVADYCNYVIAHSDNAADVIQAYYRTYACSDSSQYDIVHHGEMERSVQRLVSLRVKTEAIVDFLFWLVSRYKGSFGNEHDEASKDTFTALASQGQTDALLQLSARLGLELEGILAMARIGSIDAVIRQAAQVPDIENRRDILDALVSRAYLDKDARAGHSCKVVDRLCREWFGYPPPRPSYQDAYQASLHIWAQALEELGVRNEAVVVRKAAERRGWLR